MLLRNPDCDVNATGRANVTPLHLAAGMDRVNVCKMLVSDGYHCWWQGDVTEENSHDVTVFFFFGNNAWSYSSVACTSPHHLG